MARLRHRSLDETLDRRGGVSVPWRGSIAPVVLVGNRSSSTSALGMVMAAQFSRVYLMFGAISNERTVDCAFLKGTKPRSRLLRGSKKKGLAGRARLQDQEERNTVLYCTVCMRIAGTTLAREVYHNNKQSTHRYQLSEHKQKVKNTIRRDAHSKSTVDHYLYM
jgi:hypothetical protein